VLQPAKAIGRGVGGREGLNNIHFYLRSNFPHQRPAKDNFYTVRHITNLGDNNEENSLPIILFVYLKKNLA